jgi:glyoxylase-like metal-dependent hydrolase (beta-lactamase superfamily II)
MKQTRRGFLASSAGVLSAAALGRVRLFAGQQAPVTPVITEIRRGVGTWTARGGTIGWLINDGGVIAVDSQFPDTAALCVDALLQRSRQAGLAALINTHHHGDHTGGNGVFRPKTAQIIGHANVPGYMQSSWELSMKRRAETTPPPTTPAPAAPVVPDRTFTDTWSFEHGDERVTARYYGAGHTGGDAVIHFEKANVAHMGDLMFNRLHPVIDRVNGASIENWSAVLNTVAGTLPADTTFIFGHAGTGYPVTGSRADLQHHAGYLTALLEYVRGEVKAGKSREEVVASTALIKGYEDYGPLIARPLGPAYDEVTNAPR